MFFKVKLVFLNFVVLWHSNCFPFIYVMCGKTIILFSKKTNLNIIIFAFFLFLFSSHSDWETSLYFLFPKPNLEI
ncbi:hypothetical protein IC575_022918 [Cucumis melo]